MKANDYEGRRNISGERVREAAVHAPLSSGAGGEGSDRRRGPGADAISRIELGDRMVQDYELWALSSVLGVSADWLLCGDMI